MQSKTWLMALATTFATLLGPVPAAAQDYPFGWNPRSGDAWVDTWLGDMNRYGSRYRDPFVDEMVRYYGAPRELVTDLLVDRHWAPGDVYYACAIGAILGRPCRYVVDIWNRDHEQGWGQVAQTLGIKPGSPEFHRLKKGFVPTYDRWARPITIDADLQRDFPERGKAQAKGHSDNGNGKAKQGKPAQGNAEKGNAEKGNAEKGKGKGHASR
jgi:hypothetical protein